MKKHYRQETNCLNCGTDLQGKFCHICGQENLQIKESFGHMLNHAVSDYFHFDHQFFHTLKPLFLQPGKLTNEYIAGRRMQYLHPVKMYIFISLVFFIVYFNRPGHDLVKFDDTKKTEHQSTGELKSNIVKSIEKDKHLTPSQRQAIKDKIIADSVNKVKIVHSDINKTSVVDKDEEVSIIGLHDEDSKTYEEYLNKQAKLPVAERDNFFVKYFMKKSYAWDSHGKDAKEMFNEAIKHNMPKMMFLLLPLFALILSVAFWKNKRFYVEHLIYSFHLHCFVFLFLTFIILLKMLMPVTWVEVSNWLDIISFIVISIYIYKSLKAVYQRTRFRTITKMIGMGLMYLLVFGVCMMLMVGIVAITSV